MDRFGPAACESPGGRIELRSGYVEEFHAEMILPEDQRGFD